MAAWQPGSLTIAALWLGAVGGRRKRLVGRGRQAEARIAGLRGLVVDVTIRGQPLLQSRALTSFAEAAGAVLLRTS